MRGRQRWSTISRTVWPEEEKQTNGTERYLKL